MKTARRDHPQGALTMLGGTALYVGAVLGSGVSDLRVIATLAIPLGILCGAVIVPWCGAQVLAMMGDLQVRQDEARRARSE